MEKKDLIFVCRKCGHRLYLSDWQDEKQMKKMLKLECPECGEEPEELWQLSGFGKFKK